MNHEPKYCIRRSNLLRSPPSIQLTTYNAHAHTIVQEKTIEKKPISRSSLYNKHEWSRTQHKLMLQRQSFLADDKNYLDHPDNMRKLTKELERVNREYRCVRQFEDPLALSIQRVTTQQQVLASSPSSTSSWSSHHSSLSSPRLQRRASCHTVHDYLMSMKDERRHSLTLLMSDKPTSIIGRLFGSSTHQPIYSSQLKRPPIA
ncbi:hypothetical protein BDB01DRAFT_854418 [Pilobolus umbonatus]|nr:hypothetical protein BDB01DRAFT_854418 [Pilobolus umbonatus]